MAIPQKSIRKAYARVVSARNHAPSGDRPTKPLADNYRPHALAAITSAFAGTCPGPTIVPPPWCDQLDHPLGVERVVCFRAIKRDQGNRTNPLEKHQGRRSWWLDGHNMLQKMRITMDARHTCTKSSALCPPQDWPACFNRADTWSPHNSRPTPDYAAGQYERLPLDACRQYRATAKPVQCTVQAPWPPMGGPWKATRRKGW